MPAKRHFLFFHRWGKWEDGGEFRTYWRTDAIGIPLAPVEQTAVSNIFVVQHSRCEVCNALRTRRVKQ